MWFGDNQGQRRSRLSDLLLRRQRVWPGAGQELLGEGRVARRVPDQDRPADETPGPDAHRRAVPTDVDRRRSPAARSACRSPPAASQQLFFALGAGFPYQGQWPVWTASVSSSAGFVPAFDEPAEHRYALPRRAREADAGGMRPRRDQGSGVSDPKAWTRMSITTVGSLVLLFWRPDVHDHGSGFRWLSGSLIPDPRSRPASPPMRVAVVTSSPPMAEGGHMVIARVARPRRSRARGITPTSSSRRRTGSAGRPRRMSRPG